MHNLACLISDVAHLSAELVCSFVGQSAAFPPAADPCRMCAGDAEAPEGTRSPAGEYENQNY